MSVVYAPVDEALVAWGNGWGSLLVPEWSHSTEMPADLSSGVFTRWTQNPSPAYRRLEWPQFQALTIAQDKVEAQRFARDLVGRVESGLHGQVVETETGRVALAWRRTTAMPVWVDWGSPDVHAYQSVFEFVAHHQG